MGGYGPSLKWPRKAGTIPCAFLTVAWEVLVDRPLGQTQALAHWSVFDCTCTFTALNSKSTISAAYLSAYAA